MTSVAALTRESSPGVIPASDREYLTFFVGSQLFGVPVLTVRDVLKPQALAHIPLAPAEVAGALNLRGRIITAVDVTRRLSLPAGANDTRRMNVVVGHGEELYSLMVDTVGEVLSITADKYERDSSTLDPKWREFSDGVYRLDKHLMIVLNVEKLLDIGGD